VRVCTANQSAEPKSCKLVVRVLSRQEMLQVVVVLRCYSHLGILQFIHLVPERSHPVVSRSSCHTASETGCRKLSSRRRSARLSCCTATTSRLGKIRELALRQGCRCVALAQPRNTRPTESTGNMSNHHSDSNIHRSSNPDHSFES